VTEKHVVFCIPIAYFNGKPHPKTVESLEAELPILEAAGWKHGLTHTKSSPYISGARADMTRRALDTFPSDFVLTDEPRKNVIFYIDHDVSWKPGDLLRVLETEGDVVAGTYRTKEDGEVYMGAVFSNEKGTPLVRESDGAIKTKVCPAGFLKVTTKAIDNFMVAYPELTFGPMYALSVDLFNHGARNRLWWGEDYAFADRYNAKCGDVWIVPNLNIAHWAGDKCYPGNFHEFLLKQPGGSNDPQRA